MFKLFLITLGLCQIAFSKVFFWDATWVNASPDGFSRPVIGINGQWPCPAIDVNVGDRVTIVLTNKLGNQTTGLHFHGLLQMGSDTMDGPSSVTQCPIPPGSTFTYSFIASTPGTYWYHSHNMAQYPDGLRGPLIVRDPNAPYKNKVDKEFILTVSDWYHDEMPTLLNSYQALGGNGIEPVPWSVFFNDGQGAKYNVEAGKTYLFRVINIGAFPSFFINFQDHNMTIVEMDGVYTAETLAPTFYVGSAMRYSVLVTANADKSKNYGILGLADGSMFRGPSPNPTFANATYGTLVYDSALPIPAPHPPVMPPIDDVDVLPLDGMKILGPVTKQFVLDFNITNLAGQTRAVINDITYVPPKVPSLYTALSVGKKLATDMRVYGVNSNPLRIDSGDIVEVVIKNHDSGGHPWHLHGHFFQVVARSQANVIGTDKDFSANTPLAPVPMRRDTAGVRSGGYTVIRFKADNPGTHLLHCHIEWHMEAGLIATFIEAVDQLNLKIPFDHKLACLRQGMPYQGNAAGNTKDALDLTGANMSPDQNVFGASYSKRPIWAGGKGT